MPPSRAREPVNPRARAADESRFRENWGSRLALYGCIRVCVSIRRGACEYIRGNLKSVKGTCGDCTDRGERLPHATPYSDTGHLFNQSVRDLRKRGL